MNAKKHTETLADKLPYFEFDPEIDAIWLMDGSATLSLKICPKNCASLTDEELESLRHGLTPVLGHLPEGSVFQALLLRERSTAASNEAFLNWRRTHAGTEGALVLDESRALLFESRERLLKEQFDAGQIFQTRCYVTLRVIPDIKVRPGKTVGALSHLAFSFAGKSKELKRKRRKMLEDLQEGLESLRVGLTSLGFDVIPVSHEERVRVIYEWLNPERSKTLPAPQTSNEQTLSDRMALTDLIEDCRGLALGRTGVEIVTLKTLPEISIPAMMEALASAPVPFSLIFTVYVLPQTQERERLLRKQRLAQGMASGNVVRNLMAETQLRDIEDTLNALISSGEKLLGISCHLAGLRESPR